MTDIDKIYECILDKTYQNKSEFEIILSDIEDKELVVGFIFDILLKHAAYEADKQSMLELIADVLGNGSFICALSCCCCIHCGLYWFCWIVSTSSIKSTSD